MKSDCITQRSAARMHTSPRYMRCFSTQCGYTVLRKIAVILIPIQQQFIFLLICLLATLTTSAVKGNETPSEQKARAEQEEAQFYEAYPTLSNEREMVEAAFRSLRSEGYKGKDINEAYAAIVARTQEFIARRSPEEWQKHAVALYPELGVASSPLHRRFISRYNELKRDNPQYFDDRSWPINLARECAGNIIAVQPAPHPDAFPLPLTAAGENQSQSQSQSQLQVQHSDNTDHFSKEGVIVVVALGCILLFLAGRASRSTVPDTASLSVNTTQTEPDSVQPSAPSFSPWKHSLQPAVKAAEWASLVGMLSAFRSHQLGSIENIKLLFLISAVLAIIVSVPVYIIAVLYYTIKKVRIAPPSR